MLSLGWEDVVARVRGLGTHLPSTAVLRGFASAADLAALARRLAEARLVAADTPITPQALELELRRWAGRELRILERWLGDRVEPLFLVFGEEDRRSVRALIRGAAAGLPPSDRVSGLIPTPGLPERVLQQLAERRSPGEVGSSLAFFGHPFGAAIARLAAGEEPDLFAIELAVNRAFIATARTGARRGDRVLREEIELVIDLANAESATGLAGGSREADPDAFLPGGRRLSRAQWALAVGAGSREAGVAAVAPAFTADGLEEAVRLLAASPGRFERLALVRRIRRLATRARIEPLGSAPVLVYALRLRALLLRIRAIVWGVVLGVPQGRLDALLEEE